MKCQEAHLVRSRARPAHRSQRFVERNTLLTGPAMLARGKGNSQCCSCEVLQRLNRREPLGTEGGSKRESVLASPQRWPREAKNTSRSELYKEQ